MRKTIDVQLSSEEKAELIDLFYTSYFNTDQPIEFFGNEFFFVVGSILQDRIPTGLIFLNEDYEEEMFKVVPRLKGILKV